MAHKLVISITIEDEDSSVEMAKDVLNSLSNGMTESGKWDLRKDVQVALIREGDRSAGNLLLPRLNGRFGEHYQNRKASLSEVLKDSDASIPT